MSRLTASLSTTNDSTTSLRGAAPPGCKRIANPVKYMIYISRVDGVDGCASTRSSPIYQGARLFCSGPLRYTKKSQTELAYIDTLANSKMRVDSVKRMTQIQNTSWSFAETKYFSVAAREHTLAPPGRHRRRHSRMRLTGRKSRPAIDGAFYYPVDALYQLQPSFHTSSTEPEPTARARRAGKEFY